MDLMACVNLPAFPLQLLIRRHPHWKNLPAVVVDKDKPQGIIQWVNKHAMRHRILPGMGYAKGLSLSPELRAGVVSDTDIQEYIDDLIERFRFFTPDVEPSQKEPGVFWLNASGFSLLHPSLKKWAGLIGRELSQIGFYWSAAVGFTRYGTYATAKSSKKIVTFEDPDEERAHVRGIPIVRLGFDPKLRIGLDTLAITTLGGFLDLPADGIYKRFGKEADALYKLAKNELYAPLDSCPPEEPFSAQTDFDHPETDIARLMPVIENLMGSIFDSLAKKNHLLAAVTLSLTLDNGDKHNEHLRPAKPTNDAKQILKLVELRLQKISLASGVTDIVIDADAAPAAHRQLELFAARPRRDLAAVDRAFALLRAEFGDKAVMKARLKDGHLPEACYQWEPMEKLTSPSPHKVTVRRLVRRIFVGRSIAFLLQPRANGDGRLFSKTEDNSNVIGPYIISGGWWRRKVHREYYFVRNPQGRWLWIYYDRRRRQSFVQGEVG